MSWYYAEAGTQTGPVTDEQFVELVRTGRITAETLVWQDGMPDWMQYGQLATAQATTGPAAAAVPAGTVVICAECKKTFPVEETIRHGNSYICANCQPVFMQKLAQGAPLGDSIASNKTEEEILAREYRIEIGDALGQAWKVFTNNGGLMIGAIVIVVIIFVVGWGVTSVLSRATFGAGGFLSLLYATPLAAGLPWLALRAIRGEDCDIGDVFEGFRSCYGRLFLFGIVQLLLNIICFLPFIALAISFGLAGAVLHKTSPPDMAAGIICGMIVAGTIGICALIYINTIFNFTILLIMDKDYRLWPAMRLSQRMVSRRWWMTFLYLFLSAVIYSLGTLVCLVGLFVTAPLFFNMRAILYNDNFRDLAPQK